jgi:hypothetical protein
MTQTAALTHEERAEIRALSERATPGEWSVEGPSRGFAGYIIHGAGYVELASLLESSESDAEADAAFIAAARPALPRLLDALEAAERERDRLAEANWKGAALLNNARDTLAMIAADEEPWHTCTHADEAQRALEDSAP